MNKTLSSRQIVSFAIPTLLIAIIIFIARSPVLHPGSSALSFGITFDLLVSIPVLYFLLIRKTNIPTITIVPLFIIVTIVATWILPSENQQFLRYAKIWILPIVEATMVILTIYKFREAIKHFKKSKEVAFDFFTALQHACSKILPAAIVVPFATEVAVFYYGFIHWKKVVPANNEFTYHRDSGIVTILVVIIFIVGIETFVIHLLLLKWSPTAAWIMTALSLYTATQLFGFLRSITKRPIAISGDKLCLRYGILSEATIDIGNIASVELTTRTLTINKETKMLSSLADLEGHNVVITLKQESTLTGLYGIKRKFKTIALFIDDRDEFRAQLEIAQDNLSAPISRDRMTH